MEALAEAAGVEFADILALNLRSELALTHYTDGCTSIAHCSQGGNVFIAQNWDWMDSQSRSLLGLEVRQPGKPVFFIVAEAGIVGKYGFNDRGVGVCLNAILCGAGSTDKLPVHVALRKVLECGSYAEARRMLDDPGVAAAANLVMADRSGKCASIEVSPRGNFDILPDREGVVCHTNHLYAEQATAVLKDHPSTNSFTRLDRIKALADGTNPSFEGIRAILSDRSDGDYSISRSSKADVAVLDRISTLVTIIVDLVGLKAELSLGRPDLNPEVLSIVLGSE
jgi:isopenicillin-N N-acyltransferase-like protein